MRDIAFIHLQTIRLAKSAPILQGAWTSCKKGMSLSRTSERYWAEIRGDVILLYPGSEIARQFHMHIHRRGIDRDPTGTQKFLEENQRHMKPQSYYSYIHTFSNRVPKKKIIPVLFRACQTDSDLDARSITFTGYNASAIFPQKSVTLKFDTVHTLVKWKDVVFRIPEVYRRTLSDFSLVKHIGKGATSDVFLVRDRFSRESVAMKAIDKEDAFLHRESLRRIIDERIVHYRMRKHPYILEMSQAFETEEKLYVASEYCSRGDLFHYLRDRGGRVPETIAKLVTAEVLLSLEVLHDQGIWYRDLKPENVMVADNGHVKLGDFGAAKITNPKRPVPRTNSSIGTIEYLAPEMAEGKPHGRMVDIWAFGIFICELLNGETPFEGDTETMTYENIRGSPLILPATMPMVARDLVRRLLRRGPSMRLGSGVNGWQDVKDHLWFKDINWETLLLRPPSEGPFGSYDKETTDPPKSPFMEDDPSFYRIMEEGRQKALNSYNKDLLLDFQRTTSIRAAHGRGSNTVQVQNKRIMKRTFGAYGCGESFYPLSFDDSEPLTPWYSTSQSRSNSTGSTERNKTGLWSRVSSFCSRFKIWRNR